MMPGPAPILGQVLDALFWCVSYITVLGSAAG